jgi:hypothetical protein
VIVDHWPLFGLRLLTPRLELRVPDHDDLGALADLAAAGIHDPQRQPFVAAWPVCPPACLPMFGLPSESPATPA